MDRRIFWLLSAAIVLLAFVLRDLHIARIQMLNPLGGDAYGYVQYAIHMHLGYFGFGAEPDSFRPPGYPALIALAQLVDGDSYQRLLRWQALMGAATVAFTIAIGRQWLPQWAALLAGLLLALWPHHIVFSAEVLTEILAGFLLSAALLVAVVAKQRAWAWGCAGLLFAAGALVNTVFVLVPVVVGIALIGRAAPARWLALLVPVVVIVGGWSMRPVDGGMDRALWNLVQGSHPLYHEAYARQFTDPRMATITRQIEEETRSTGKDPVRALRAIASRVADEPGRHLAWYASKPWHLWDWDIRISQTGGPYVHKVRNSILDAPPVRAFTIALHAVNPLLFVASLLAALFAAIRPGPAGAVALSFLYFTLVHTVLQAEPRYSIPLRSLQMLLVASALTWCVSAVRTRLATPAPRPEPPR